MTYSKIGNAPGLGSERCAVNQESANNGVDCADICNEKQRKPDVDLKSWAALGGNVKPSRADRLPKKSWRRTQR